MSTSECGFYDAVELAINLSEQLGDAIIVVSGRAHPAKCQHSVDFLSAVYRPLACVQIKIALAFNTWITCPAQRQADQKCLCVQIEEMLDFRTFSDRRPSRKYVFTGANFA